MIRTAAALLLLLTIPASAQTPPISPDTGSVMCPAAWIIDNGGKPFCQVPPGAGLIALPEAEDKARTERMRAIARDHGARPYSGHGH